MMHTSYYPIKVDISNAKISSRHALIFISNTVISKILLINMYDFPIYLYKVGATADAGA